jgi:uncharacterized membrane protein
MKKLTVGQKVQYTVVATSILVFAVAYLLEYKAIAGGAILALIIAVMVRGAATEEL